MPVSISIRQRDDGSQFLLTYFNYSAKLYIFQLICLRFTQIIIII